MSTRTPPLFLSHGAPTLALEDNATTRFLTGWPARLGKWSAALVVSAHWIAPELRVTAWETQPILHDFSGFPAPLYEMDYPAPGSPGLARRVAQLCSASGLEAPVADGARGLDHGAWVPLRLMASDAARPVLQLALPAGWGPERIYGLGQALAPLRDEGILLIGSGGAVHNLGELAPEGTPPADWAAGFRDWLAGRLTVWDTAALFAYREGPAHGARAHPTDEHILPLFFPMGAASSEGRAEVAHDTFMYGNLSMLAARFG